MATFHCNFFSRALCCNTDIYVIIPTLGPAELGVAEADPGEKYQTLYLLHGMYGDYTDWLYNTQIEAYAHPYRLAVVMPSAANSFYTDMAHGQRYFTYITEELPAFVQRMFPVSGKREDTFIAGLSMGGYGAYKAALNHPERYGCAASLSGTLAIVTLYNQFKAQGNLPIAIEDIWEDAAQLEGTGSDLVYLLEKLKKENALMPRLFQACGTEDGLYPLNVAVRNRIRAMGIELTYFEAPGAHDWRFWDTAIQKVLSWLPLK